MLDREKITSALQGAGYRLTPQRRAMLDYLASTDETHSCLPPKGAQIHPGTHDGQLEKADKV